MLINVLRMRSLCYLLRAETILLCIIVRTNDSDISTQVEEVETLVLESTEEAGVSDKLTNYHPEVPFIR